MSAWGFWEWIAYSTLALSALILTGIQGSKDMTFPSWVPGFLSKIPWSYLPLLLLVIATAIFISKELGWIGSSHKEGEAVKFIKWPDPYKPISVVNKTFRNEKVVLDGHSYSNCKFYNVTFVYNGTTTIIFSNNEVYGAFLSSDNPAVNGAFMWMLTFKDVIDQFKLEMPPSWEPMKKAP